MIIHTNKTTTIHSKT